MRSGEVGSAADRSPTKRESLAICSSVVRARACGSSPTQVPIDSQAVVFHSPFEENQELRLARQNLQQLASHGIERVIELYFVCFRSPPSAVIG